jgi:hypothetical protein
MKTDAMRILEVFRTRGLRAGGFISFTDFDDVIVWENGFMRDESVRQGLAQLIEEDFVLEMCAGLQLTPKGESTFGKPGDAAGL